MVTDLYLILGKIKARALFRSAFRGTVRSAVTFAYIIAHTVNARIRKEGGDYEGYGNWGHFPEDE